MLTLFFGRQIEYHRGTRRHGGSMLGSVNLNIPNLGQRPHLKLEELSSLIYQYSIISQILDLIRCIDFYFSGVPATRRAAARSPILI